MGTGSFPTRTVHAFDPPMPSTLPIATPAALPRAATPVPAAARDAAARPAPRTAAPATRAAAGVRG